MQSKDITDFKRNGYILFSNKNIEYKIKVFEDSLKKNFLSKFNKKEKKSNLNLIKRISGDLNVFDVLHDVYLIKKIQQLSLSYPVQSGPIVTHYTSTNSISNSFGLPYHQDWPSMASSKNSLIVWFNVNNFEKDLGHGIEVLPKSHKKIFRGKSTNKGYEIFNSEIKNFKNEIIIPKYEVLIMSSYLVHRSYIDKQLDESYWRLGVSTRFDDLNCVFWKKNDYSSAYGNIVDRNLFKKLKF